MENFVVYREVVATYATIVQAESEEQAYEIIDTGGDDCILLNGFHISSCFCIYFN